MPVPSKDPKPVKPEKKNASQSYTLGPSADGTVSEVTTVKGERQGTKAIFSNMQTKAHADKLTKYKVLIEKFPLIPIKSDTQLSAAHKMARSLFDAKLDQYEEGYLEILLNEIQKYEEKHHPLKVAEFTPLEMLKSFMEDHKLKQVDLSKIIKCSSGVASEIVSGKRELSKEQVILLADHFCVSTDLFLPKVDRK